MKRVLLYIGIALVAIGCAKEETITTTPTDGEINFSAGVTTRVSSSDDCAWELGDKVGIFTDQSGETNLLFTISDTSTGAMTNASGTTLIPLEGDGETRNYYAYYPYVESSNEVDMSKSENWALNFDYNAAEYPTLQSEFLLYATTTSNDTDVELTFTHMFPKLTINLTAGGVDVTSLDGATVALKGANSKGKFNLESGEFVFDATDTYDIALTVDVDDNEISGSITAYIPPMESVSGNVQLWITSADGDIFIYPITTDEWVSGYEYKYDITVGETSN